MKGKSPIELEGGGANGFVISPDGYIIVWGDHGPWRVDRPFYALGSGSTVAMGAMQQGASAVEAVEAAIALDIYSGGPIRVLKQEP